jgi:hypothetical protein
LRVVSKARLKESAQECRRLIRDAHDFVRCLAIEFEIEFGFGTLVVPVAKTFQLTAPEAPLGECMRLILMLTRGVCRATPRFFAIALAEVTTPLAMRPDPPSFSLAKTKITWPVAMYFPPYIVF